MTEHNEARASHGEVEAFVGKLREFHSSLGEGERAMMEAVLEYAQGGETGGYRYRWSRYEDATDEASGSESSSGWNDLIGWIEEQGEDDTQGFWGRKF